MDLLVAPGAFVPLDVPREERLLLAHEELLAVGSEGQRGRGEPDPKSGGFHAGADHLQEVPFLIPGLPEPDLSIAISQRGVTSVTGSGDPCRLLEVEPLLAGRRIVDTPEPRLARAGR